MNFINLKKFFFCDNTTYEDYETCIIIPTRIEGYSQIMFLLFIILVAGLICISFVIYTKRKHVATDKCAGFGGLPACINMLGTGEQ